MAIKSKGKRPFIVKMPNEPNPLNRWQETFLYEYRGGKESDPNNYSNFKGQTMVDYVRKNSSKTKWMDFQDRAFRSKETMINWLLRNGFVARDIPEGVYLRWGYGDEDRLRDIAYKDTEEYLEWKEGNVYTVATVEDPSIPEPYGDVVYLDSPKDIPEGAKFAKRSGFDEPHIFYGHGAEAFVKRTRENARSMASRRYTFKGRIEDLTPEQARMLGFEDDDIKISEEIYINPYGQHKGPGNVVGDIIRTKNTRPGTDGLPAIGQEVYTPRFLHVDIYEVFPTYREMCKAGYTEPTHFDGPFEVQGKVTGQYTMKFAASPKRP